MTTEYPDTTILRALASTGPWRGKADWSRRSVVLLKPDCLERHLVEKILSHIADVAEIVARQNVVVTASQIFAHYDDLLVDPERFDGVDVPKDLRRRYVGHQVVIALAFGDPGTPEKLRGLLGHFDPARSALETIRGRYGTDSLAQARAEGRLIDNLIHTSDDAHAACRDFGIWFGSDRTDLLIRP